MDLNVDGSGLVHLRCPFCSRTWTIFGSVQKAVFEWQANHLPEHAEEMAEAIPDVCPACEPGTEHRPCYHPTCLCQCSPRLKEKRA